MTDPVEPFVQQCLDQIEAAANLTPTVPPPLPPEWAKTPPLYEPPVPPPITPPLPPAPPAPNPPYPP